MCKKDASINIREAFIDVTFEDPPRKPIEEVHEVLQLIEPTLKITDESYAIVKHIHTSQRTDQGNIALSSISLAYVASLP